MAVSKEELRRMGLLGAKTTYKDPITGKMKTIVIDGEDCGLYTKEEGDRVCHNGRKDTKYFDPDEETEKYNKRLKGRE